MVNMLTKVRRIYRLLTALPCYIRIIYCMVSVQQANLSECKGRKTSITTPFLLESISLIWDSRVMLNLTSLYLHNHDTICIRYSGLANQVCV